MMKPAIIGLSGPTLAPDEAALLQAEQPAGIILFARNVQDPRQLGALIAQARAVLPLHALIMVDQEGGRVARLRPPHWRAHPPASGLGSERAAWLTGALIGLDCAEVGFNLVAAPILDLSWPGGHDVIGDRAFSADPQEAARLAGAFAAGLLAAGVQPIGKHAPGHGRARADSHLALPVLDDVADADLIPFVANNALPWLMTAHIRYTARDMLPATISPAIITDIIRGRIGFRGVLITDDLAMNALSGTPGERAAAALGAGCDIALHCSGVLEESRDVLASIGLAGEACHARLTAARDMASAARQPLDAGTLDAGTLDAGTLDAGTLDAERAGLLA